MCRSPVAETVGVEQRGKFYEATGALRDMVPNQCVHAAFDFGHGAADRLRCRCDLHEEAEVLRSDACHQAGTGGNAVSMAPARW